MEDIKSFFVKVLTIAILERDTHAQLERPDTNGNPETSAASSRGKKDER